jgi:hypothetical protein
MLKSRLWLIGILACLAATGVDAQKNESTPADTPSNGSGPIRFKMIRLHQEHGNDCQLFRYEGAARGVCLWFNLEYPEVISAPNEAVKTKITQVIQRWVLQEWCQPGYKTAKTPEMVMQNFIDREKVLRNRVEQVAPEDKDQIELFDRKVKVDYESAHVLSLGHYEECKEMDGMWDEGGIEYMNFRPSTGEPIRLEDVMKPGFEEPLNSIGERRFRAQYKIDANASLAEAGFHFPQNHLQLNRNFSIGRDGLTFFYHTDEIGPRARGGTSFFLPYSDFRSLLRPDAHIP